MIGIPVWLALRCLSRKPPSTIVCPSFTSTCVAASRVEELPPADRRIVLKLVDALLETRRRTGG